MGNDHSQRTRSSDALLAFRVRAKPGARRDRVGGSYGDSGALIVSVRARAVDGAANDAVVALLASAFGVGRRAVAIQRGDRSRDKWIAIAGDPETLQARLDALLRA
jgi:uncharacterized protein YggU (UPF0235/DUF167 family)